MISPEPERVLVTGGLGFQGLWLARALVADGRLVTVLNTPSQRAMRAALIFADEPARCRPMLVYGSAADPELLEKLLPDQDAVIHLAAWASVDVSLDRPWPPYEINTTGTVALLDGLRRFGRPGVRVLIASSCEVYGPAERWVKGRLYDVGGMPFRASVEDEEMGACVPQHETDEHRPRSPYAASKSAADRYAYAYAVAYGMNLTILRPSNVYGPFQRAGAAGAVIPTLTRAALHPWHPLRLTGGGEQAREFLHVDDIVAAYRLLLDRPAGESGEAFNVGSGEVRTVRQVAEAVMARFGLPAHRLVAADGRPADVSAFRLDSSKLGALGWKPTVRFDEGLTRYFDWAETEEGRA